MARYFKARLLVYALVFLTLLTGTILSSSYIRADNDRSPDDTISCTFTYNEGESRSVSMTNGSYLSDIGNSTMKTICNDNSGYAIYAVGYSNDEFGNNNMIATINGALNPTYNIASSNASSGNTSAWAMKANAIAGTYAPTIDNEFGQYSAVPNEYQRLVYLTNTTDDTVGSSISLSYAIYVSGTQPAGSYTGKVKYTLVHPYDEFPCIEGQICYKANANNVVGKMGKQTTSGVTATLWASNYSHEGYGFAGWNTKSDGTGTSYGPNETITLPDDMSEGLTLYAMWIKSAGNLQDWGGCYTMSIGDVTALTDERDNDTYAIAKLADGNCWMIENLRLDYDATRGTANQALAQGYGGVFTGLAEPETENFAITSTPNSLYTTDTASVSLNIIEGDNLNYRFPRYNNSNTADRVATMTGTGQSIYSYGNYYSFISATANTDDNRTNNESLDTSICPTGWRLPRGGDKDNEANNEYWALVVDELNGGVKPSDYDSEIKPIYDGNPEGVNVSRLVRKYPNNFLYSGRIDGSTLNFRGVNGGYWTSTVENNSGYGFYINNSFVYPGTRISGKYYGRSVRCVSKFADYSITYEQNTNDTVTNMPAENPQTGSVEHGTNSVTLSDTVPLRREYRFKGWCDEPTNDGTCSGNVYNPNGDGTNLQFPLDFTSSQDYTLYAMWVIPPDPCANITSTKLYDLVACRSKGKQTVEELTEELTEPTSRNSAADTSTSGVYEYDASVFGTASDASNDYNIYYYRGILDSDLDGTSATYGSNGNGYYYPNYVILDEDGNKDTSDTCWRIMRTTGSGGVKMIYNGTWNGTSCANTEAQTGTVAWNTNANISARSIISGGYTFNSNYKTTTTDTKYSTLFGSNTSYAGNNTDSTIKNYVENTWFPVIDEYESMLETSAGYCNDRTLYYRENKEYKKVGDNDYVSYPYSEEASSNWYYFGGAVRNRYSIYVPNQAVTLTCERDRADNYSVAGASTGNGQLTKPVGLITIDEIAFAGSGINQNFIHYGEHPNSYLVASNFSWTMTPGFRGPEATTERAIVLYSHGPNDYPMTLATGVRPVVSFKKYTKAKDGSGTATDPWVVDLVYSMQTVSTWGSSLNIGDEVQAIDERDDKIYTVAKLADGNIWMTQNLDHDIVTTPNFYTYKNTDIGHGATQNVNAKWTASKATYTTDNLTWVYDDTLPESYDPGDKIWDGVPDTTWAGTLDTMTQGTDAHYHIGNYYNWPAAVAKNSTSSITTSNTDVDQSICPAGWTLPKAGNNYTNSGSFQYLMNSYNYDPSTLTITNPSFWEDPLYFTLGGEWDGTSAVVGTVGSFWSSVSSKTNSAYVLNMDGSDYVGESDYYGRKYGYFIRCVAR